MLSIYYSKIHCKSAFYLLLLLIVCFSSCKKLVEVDSPKDLLIGKDIYNDPSTAAAVLTGIYQDLSFGSFAAGGSSLSVLCGLSADELTLLSVNDQAKLRFYTNTLSASTQPPEFWSSLYGYIYRANSAIEGLTASSSLNAEIKNQLLGEAHFIRSLCYFYIVNLYGDAPLIVTTDYKITSSSPRISKSEVYEQIIEDLKAAQQELNAEYLAADIRSTKDERLRPNKATAIALLARIYLYTQQWSLAEEQATAVIDNQHYELLGNLNDVFLKNSREAIWQLQPVGIGNTPDGSFFVHDDNFFVFLDSDFYTSFESGDKRKSQWVATAGADSTNSSYPFKYKINGGFEVEEYTMVLRLSEQYLIRAEARAMQNNITGTNSGASDIDTLRHRAGLNPIIITSQEELVNAILDERRHELFTEWGHRWFDLKRLDKVNQVMETATSEKGSSWSPNWALYPIPQTDINRNPALAGKQNAGY